MVFLRFLCCSSDPLRGAAWSRCKNPWFFAISNLLARPSAGIGVVEVQKPMVFCDFCGARATLCGNRRGRFFVRTGPRELSRGARACSRNRRVAGSIPPWSAGGRRKMQRRATCTEQLAQSSLHRATCRERNLHRATCRDQLAGATCAEQLAQSNLHSATCVEQLAQTNLHRPVCAEHLAWCCLALASRSVGKKNASCSVGPTSLAMFCFRANRGLVFMYIYIYVCALEVRAGVNSPFWGDLSRSRWSPGCPAMFFRSSGDGLSRGFEKRIGSEPQVRGSGKVPCYYLPAS